MKNVFVILAMVFVSNFAMAACETSSATLAKNNSVSCSNHSGPASVSFTLKPKSTFGMYITYEMLGNCEHGPAYFWEKLDAAGNLISSTAVGMGDDINVTAGNSYRMRVDLGDVSACPYYTLDFGLETF